MNDMKIGFKPVGGEAPGVGKTPENDRRAPPFSRAVSQAEPEADAADGKRRHVGGPQAARHASGVEPSPLKDVAQGLVSASEALHRRLVHEGVGSPDYLGGDKGEWAYRNPANGEVCIQNFSTRSGLAGLDDFLNVCTVKPNGAVFLNGEAITARHPEAQRVEEGINRFFQKIANDDLQRGSSLSGGNLASRPWDPASPAHHNYAG